jgi:hypothetical protein
VPTAISPGAVGSDGEDLNVAGTAVGTTRFGVTANHAWNRATAWSPGGTADVGLGLGRRDSRALAIGPNDDVVGTAWHGRDDTTCPQEHCPFLVRDGKATALNGFIEVRDIDGTGRIVGWGGESGMARWWQGGRYQSLVGTMATGTNDAGTAVGQDLEGWAVTWQGTTATRLPRPWCSVTSTANAVGSTGQVAGMFDDCGDGYRAALWRDGKFVPLPKVLVGASEAFDVNGAGDAVGHAWDIFREVATLWHAGQAIDLNGYVAPELGWRLVRATGIADDGSIAGTGVFRGRGQAFVLQPPGAA